MIDIPRLRRRCLVFAAIAAAFSGPAHAQPAPTYAVLSLSGDRLSMVIPGMNTGTRLDPNVREVFKMPDDSLDVIAVEAAELAIKKIQPAAEVELYVTRDPRIFSAVSQDRDDGATTEVPALLAVLQKVLAGSRATHLLLISKHRADVHFHLVETRIRAKLHGVGYFIDEDYRTSNVETRRRSIGYVAPYASLKVQQIDLRTQVVVREVPTQDSELHPTPEGTASAWAGMSGDDKYAAVRRVIERAVADGVAKALQQP